MFDAHGLYFEGKERGRIAGFALACVELADTFRAPHTARKMWVASGFTLNQAIAAGLSAADVRALRRLAPAEAVDVLPWARPAADLIAAS